MFASDVLEVIIQKHPKGLFFQKLKYRYLIKKARIKVNMIYLKLKCYASDLHLNILYENINKNRIEYVF